MSCTFIFEVVVKRVDLNDPTINNVNEIKIIVNHKCFALNITSDRPMPLDFESGGSYEFEAFPELLRLELGIFPIKFVISYQNEDIGSTEVKLPEKLVESIDECMDDLLYCASSKITAEENCVGKIDIIIRLKVKSKFASARACTGQEAEQCVNDLLEKGDTLFVISENDNQCKRSISIKKWSTPSVLSMCKGTHGKNIDLNEICMQSNIKNGVTQFQEIKPVQLANENECNLPKSFDCKALEHLRASGDNVFHKAPKPNPNLSNGDQIPRCCPNCKTNTAWIPDLVPCYKCGYIRNPNEKSYDFNLTANEVLKMYANTCKDSSSNCSVTEGPQQEKIVKKPISKPKPKQKRQKRHKAGQNQSNSLECPKKPPNKIHPDQRLTAYIKSLLPPKENKHLQCQRGPSRVPPYMGWQWNLMATGPNKKWRPGAIRRPIREIMSWFLKDFPVDSIPLSKYGGRRERPKTNIGKAYEEDVEECPTLHILKKEHEVLVTMRPLKSKEALRDSVNPYLDMKPVQFRIIKNPIVLTMRKIKQKIKDLGYSKCVCHRPVAQCFCHSYRDQNEILRIVEDECKKEQIYCCSENLVLSDTSESESEFDFAVTPPVSRLKQYNLNKPDLVHVGTQYDIMDWKSVPKMPIKSGLAKLKLRKGDPPVLKTYACPQNIQPPIIIPKIEKPEKIDKCKGKQKGKCKAKKGKKSKKKGKK